MRNWMFILLTCAFLQQPALAFQGVHDSRSTQALSKEEDKAVRVLFRPETQPKKIEVLIPYALHYPVRRSDGSLATALDGYGHTVDGNAEPLFDTLIGVANPTAGPVNIRFRFFDMFGVPQLWGDGKPYRDYLLHSRCSLATTLIPNNVFPDPPQSFVGYARLEFTSSGDSAEAPDLPVYALIGGGGFYPDHWNTFAANIPVYKSPIALKKEWYFPYLIPQFQDANHACDMAYRTGMVITNFDSRAVTVGMTYHVGDVYSAAGRMFRFEKTILPGQSVSFDVHDELMRVGYPAEMNSEGWLTLESEFPAAVIPYLVVSNKGLKGFSAGQAGWSPE